MAGKVTELEVAARLLSRSLRRRWGSRSQPPPDLAAFRSGFRAALDRLPEAATREVRWLHLAADDPPWVDSGLLLKTGDEASYFVCGRTCVSRALDLWLEPAVQLWSRVGSDGEIISATRASHSLQAKASGSLQFGNYFPNDWADSRGTPRHGAEVYRSLRGELLVLAIRWPSTAEQGLRELVEVGDYLGLAAGELERIALGRTAPAGWSYLWNVGEAEIFRPGTDPDGRAAIECRTHRDVGILQREVELTLTPGTEVSWRWCVQALPSDIREDAVASHDYLSLAVEFDDGRDITYYWSCRLAAGVGYDCPLPNWKGREFHVVVRSGSAELGSWHQERRDLYADHRHFMGEPPGRIVKVWLIANSIFQRGTGKCCYSDIELHGSGRRVRVL